MLITDSEIFNANLLIVDDREVNITLLEQLLRETGYTRVATTMNPKDVCALHLTNNYDLILLDLQMPGMDGFQVMEGLRANVTDDYLPVLVITAHSGHKLRALQAGAKDFIIKPFDLVEAKTRIHNMLEVRLLYKKLENYNVVLEQSVQEQTRELDQKNQMLILQDRMAVMGEMISNIAHQWKQPLNILGLVIQQLPILYDTGEFSSELLKQNTAISMRLIEQMSQTVDDFRNFFRTDKEIVAFSVNRVITRTLSLIEKSFQEQRIGIDLKTEGDPTVNGYPNEYAQVLLNLFINARDALVEHKIDDAWISLRAFTEGDKAVLTITDNAGGIAEENLGKLFDAYFTTKGPEKGSGIGLFMSKTIIEKSMGGRLTVRNTGSGAEFRIEI